MLRKNPNHQNQNQNHQQKENAKIKGQHHHPKSLKNTLRSQTNADAGGILKEQTVLAAKKGKIFSSVATLCTTTAIKKIRRSQWVVLVCVTMSLHFLPRDFPAILTTATPIAPGALTRDPSVTPVTRILGLIPRKVADVQMARTRTIARANKVTASTFLPVMSMLNASSRRR